MKLFNKSNVLAFKFIAVLALLTGVEVKAYAATIHSTSDSSKKFLATSQFDQLTNALRATLSGNLTTVWRSEWKAKISPEETNLYIQHLAERFLIPK